MTTISEQLDQINELVDYCDAHGISWDALCEVVHEAASELAARVNNSSAESQIDFLCTQYGYEETKQLLKNLKENSNV